MNTLFPTLLACLLAIGSTLAEQPKIATVDIESLFSRYHRKTVVENEMQAKINALKNNPRVLAVRDLNTKLSELAAIVRDDSQPEEDRKIAAEEFNATSVEYQSLAKEMELFMAEEQRKATKQMVEAIEALMEDVRERVSEIGKSEGYDLILEIGGLTSSQTSPIIFLRNGTDISELVLERLNAEFPATEAEATPAGGSE